MSAPEEAHADSCCGDAGRIAPPSRFSSAILALGMILSAVVLAVPLKGIRDAGRTLSATGSATRAVTADFVVWTLVVKATAPDLASVHAAHTRSAARLRAWLAEREIPAEAVSAGAVVPQVLKKEWGSAEIQGYELTQTFKVSSAEIEKILAAVTAAASLLQEGVYVEPQAPEFHYTSLDSLKVDLLGAAVENAKKRAEAVAAAAGASLGAPRTVRIGVFQLRPVHSTEVSDAGMLDTSSREKEAMAVVTVHFAIR